MRNPHFQDYFVEFQRGLYQQLYYLQAQHFLSSGTPPHWLAQFSSNRVRRDWNLVLPIGVNVPTNMLCMPGIAGPNFWYRMEYIRVITNCNELELCVSRKLRLRGSLKSYPNPCHTATHIWPQFSFLFTVLAYFRSSVDYFSLYIQAKGLGYPTKTMSEPPLKVIADGSFYDQINTEANRS